MIQRYNPGLADKVMGHGIPCMIESPSEGQWVRHSDFLVAVADERTRVIEECAQVVESDVTCGCHKYGSCERSREAVKFSAAIRALADGPTT